MIRSEPDQTTRVGMPGRVTAAAGIDPLASVASFWSGTRCGVVRASARVAWLETTASRGQNHWGQEIVC